MALEKTPEGPMDSQGIKLVNPKGLMLKLQYLDYLEGLMLKLKLQYFGPDVKCQFTGKDPDAGKD